MNNSYITLHNTHFTLRTTHYLPTSIWVAWLLSNRRKRTEDRGQRTEDRGQRTEDRGIQADLIFILSTIGCHIKTTVVVEIVLVKLPTVLFPLKLEHETNHTSCFNDCNGISETHPMFNSLFTVVSERTVSTTQQYNVTQSLKRQSFYPYKYHEFLLVSWSLYILNWKTQCSQGSTTNNIVIY